MAEPRPMPVVHAARPGGATIAAYPTHERHPAVGRSIDEVRQEVDDAFADMREFYKNEPDQVMRRVMGHSARLSELRVLIMRIEDQLPVWRNVRVRDLEPTIEELQKQYLVASRLHSVRELDYKIETGER